MVHTLRLQGIEIGALLTTFNSAFDRVAMHAVRRGLVEAQAAALGAELWPVDLPWPCSNGQYEEIMSGVCREAVLRGFGDIAFGDLFLTDVREYREKMLAPTGLRPLFPIWDMPTAGLAREMIASGLKARITCVDTRQIDGGFSGREFDGNLLAELPPSADPCGERGEFHTFAYDGPMFAHAIAIESGESRSDNGFVFTDLVASA